jgi:rubrerythrin
MGEQKYWCPLCEQRFTPEKGTTPEDHLAKGIIKVLRELQKGTRFTKQCPRCGHERMTPEMYKNAWSRHADIYICDECGTDEALRVCNNDTLPLVKWYMANTLLVGILKIKCTNFIEEKDNPYPLCDNPACVRARECSMSAHMEMPEQ